MVEVGFEGGQGRRWSHLSKLMDVDGEGPVWCGGGVVWSHRTAGLDLCASLSHY